MDSRDQKFDGVETGLSERELRRFVSSIGDLLLVINDDAVITSAVKTAILGYSPAELVGREMTTLVSEERESVFDFDITTPDQLRTAVLETGGTDLTVPFETADGTTLPMTISLQPRQEAGETVCVCQDLSGVVQTTDEDSFAFVNTVPDPIYELDAENRFVRVNDAMIDFLGYDQSELLGRKISEIVPAGTEQSVTQPIPDTLTNDSQQTETVEMAFVTNSGGLILTETNISFRRTEDGRYSGAVGVVRNIRERKRRERNLDHLKQVLTRVFRHNVRNELMVVEAHAEALEAHLDRELQSHTDEILTATNRLLAHSEKARLIEEVVDTTTQQSINLGPVVREIIRTARKKHPEATLTLDIPASWSVTAHPYIDRAIEELIENAVRHAGEDDAVTVDIWVDQEGNSQTLFIEDRSGGLDKEELRILRKGTEQKLAHGSGVGLWLVRWLVEYSAAQLIVHRTDAGTIVGIRFHEQDPQYTLTDADNSPFAHAPAQIRDYSPERFHGETVIGRVETVEALEEIYDGLERTGGQTVLITGEAGVGKTTLVKQFSDRLSESQAGDPLVVEGVCKPGQQPTYYAFREILDSLPTEPTISQLRPDSESTAAASTAELQQRRESLFADIADQFRSVAADRPVVVVIEDLHNADRGTVDLFEHLIEEVGRWSHPMMFVGTYRTGTAENNPRVPEITEKIADTGRGTILELESLDAADVKTLLTALLDIDQIPDSFVQEFYDHTGGTPLFVTELAHHLLEEAGPIQSAEDLPADLRELSVPETVEQAVADRITALPDDVQDVLSTGAILGIEFSFDVLREAIDRSVDSLIACVNTLVDRKIWTRSAGQIEFLHGVVREETLAAIEQRERERIHRRVADAIETVYADNTTEHAGELAYHYEQIGAHTTAVALYQQAAERAANAYANQDAIDQYERAISLARTHDAPSESLIELCAAAGDTLRLLGKYDRAREHYQTALDHSRTTGDCPDEAAILNNIGHTYFYIGEFDEAREYYQRSLETAAQLGEETQKIDRLTNLGVIAARKGAYDSARAHYEEALEALEEINDPETVAKTYTNLGTVTYKQRDYENAREYLRQATEIYRSLDRQKETAISLHNYGMVEIERDALDHANELLTESLEIKREIGDIHEKAKSMNGLGKLSIRRGESYRAREYLENALELFQEVGAPLGEAETVSLLGELSVEQDEYEQARTQFERGLELFSEIDDHSQQLDTLKSLVDICRETDDEERGHQYYEQATAVFEDAPEPVKKQYEGWLTDLSETLD